MDSKVNSTSGGAWLFDVALPNRTTVSPDNTLFTRAIPAGGRTMVDGVVPFALLVVAILDAFAR
jgi:hypothetical protein